MLKSLHLRRVWPSLNAALRSCKLYRMESSATGAAIERASKSLEETTELEESATPQIPSVIDSSIDNPPSPSVAEESADGAASRYSGDRGYEYLQRGYSTEMFKVEIGNVPPKMGYSDIKKNLKSLKLNPGKIKKPDSLPDKCFVNFRSDEERQTAIKAIHGHVWKGRELTAKFAAPARDPLFKRKRNQMDDPETQAKRARLAAMSPEERLAEAVTPLLATPYAKQLEDKSFAVKQMLSKIAKQLLHKEAHPGQWFVDHIESCDNSLCPLLDIRASPETMGYRNKCEFSVGRSGSGPVVGFRVGSYEAGDFTVVSPATCQHIPQSMKTIAQLFEDYFQTSTFEPFTAREETGHWREVAVRCYSTGESMAVVTIHPQNLTKDVLAEEKAKMKEFFESNKQDCPLSLYCVEMGRRPSNWKPNFEHILGPEHVHESLLGLKFRISPDSFFQVNTPAAEVLYRYIGDLCSVPHPVIYDICCGTGTIGLFLAKALKPSKVIGVEMVQQAVEDARANAQINDVSCAQFVCGKAEDVMGDMLLRPGRGELVGVVDPPRGGLHPKVVEAIRKCQPLKKLIFVSCNLQGAQANIVNLCRRPSNRIKGLPFKPVSATPIDLFPHTPHCEVVVQLERTTLDLAKPD